MKMAAAEALYESSDSCAPFSLLTIGSLDGRTPTQQLEVPCLLSFLATGSIDGEVQGINDLSQQYRETDWGTPQVQHDGDFVPYVPVVYWSFRLMITMGAAAAAGAALVLWLTRRGRVPGHRWIATLGLALPVAAVLGSSFGWVFTEMGRQPWVVFGLMTTQAGVSPGVSTTEAWISLTVLTLLYGVLAVVELGLLARYVRKGPEPFEEPPTVPVGGAEDDAPMVFAY